MLAPEVSPSMTLLATLGFGFVLGLRHALDADHLVAISTIVGRHRSPWRSGIVGVWWGLGHSAALVAASLVVVGLRQSIPERVAQSLELVVGAMLVVLGVDLFRRIARGELTVHRHEHDGHTHLHAHDQASDEPAAAHHHEATRPFLVGVVHGLAGSGALTMIVVSTIASPLEAVVYIAIFGAGTLVGMLAMSALVGLPFAFASRATEGVSLRLHRLAATGSVAFGLWYSYRSVAGLWR